MSVVFPRKELKTWEKMNFKIQDFKMDRKALKEKIEMLKKKKTKWHSNLCTPRKKTKKDMKTKVASPFSICKVDENENIDKENWWLYEKWMPSQASGESAICYKLSGKFFWQKASKFSMCMPFDSANPTLGISPLQTLTKVHTPTRRSGQSCWGSDWWKSHSMCGM